MNLTVTGHHVEVTSSMRNYVADKFGRLQKHSENLFGAHVILSVEEKLRQKAEATIEVAGTKIYADTTMTDMYTGGLSWRNFLPPSQASSVFRGTRWIFIATSATSVNLQSLFPYRRFQYEPNTRTINPMFNRGDLPPVRHGMLRLGRFCRLSTVAWQQAPSQPSPVIRTV